MKVRLAKEPPGHKAIIKKTNETGVKIHNEKVARDSGGEASP